MIKSIKCFILMFIASVFVSTFPINNVYAVEDAIIAIVNDELITLKDLKEYVQATYIELKAQGLAKSELQSIMNELQSNGIEKLIEDKLILSRAKEIGITIRDKAVDQEIDKIKAKYPSEDVFEELLIKNGATITDLKNKISQQLMIKYVIEHEVRSKVYVSPKDITEYYQKNEKDFHKSAHVNLQSIYIQYASDLQKADARSKAEKALQDIKDGKDFLEVSEKYSDAPSLGEIQRGQLKSDIEDIVFNLSPNVPSHIVDVDGGFYIFNVRGRSPERIVSLEDAKDEIRKVVYQKEFRSKFEKWMKKLKTKAYVEIK